MMEEEIKEALSALNHGECYRIDQGSEAEVLVYRLHDVLVVFDIPLFGGPEIYIKTTHISKSGDLAKEINSLN